MNILALNDNQYIALRIKNLRFALSVKQVQDVIYTPTMTCVPLAANMLCGLLNLRGRIVTAIDLGIILDLGPIHTKNLSGDVPETMSIIMETRNELYSFIVDSVDEVLTIDSLHLEQRPSNLDEKWRQYTLGVFRHVDDLLVVLDEQKIFADLLPC